jgi:hypothetical protein
MKNQPKLSELSIEQLEKRAKTTKISTGALSGILLVQLAAGIYLTIKQGFNVFIILPVAFLPLVLVNISTLKKIKEEIATRK